PGATATPVGGAAGGVYFASAGHVPLVPVQDSGGSQMLPSVDAWQGVAAGAKVSTGQAALAPSQDSATSHTETAARHTAPFDTNLSAGHTADEPVHFSSRSQVPATGRQTMVAAWNLSRGQAVLTPSQTSTTSQ